MIAQAAAAAAAVTTSSKVLSETQTNKLVSYFPEQRERENERKNPQHREQIYMQNCSTFKK
jgi:hypothetical protein